MARDFFFGFVPCGFRNLRTSCAAGAWLRILQDLGHRVPEDIHIAGSDYVRYATLLARPLTTIRQPRREIAVPATRAVLERLAGPSLPPRSQWRTPSLLVCEAFGN